MEKNYMRADAIVDFEFLEEENMEKHFHSNPEILFVLEGELHVKTDDREYDLLNEDFLVINAGRLHSYQATRRFFAVRFQLSMKLLKKMLHRNSVLFWCSSVSEKSKSCEEVRKLLQNILLCNVNKSSKDEFYEKSLHYQLLSLLCGEFLLDHREETGNNTENNDHMRQLQEYIQDNYQNRISLKDAADELYLSPTYLSKYIRKRSGQGFVDLINAERLSHAMEDLMYSDAPIIKNAMDNGFASVAALNKVFKETYHTTPSAYRKEKKTKTEKNEYMKKTAACLHRYLEQDDYVRVRNEEFLSLTSDEYRSMTMENMMNVGQASDLLRASPQNKI
ncbi:MAG: AraC family transcriptional regulator, partial [Clostridiales bacterium]|nr:AraC family transcriptional regulator [Clostridiales bacterium]